MNQPITPKNEKEQKPQHSFNVYLKYSGIAFQMLVTILLGVWLGSWLDDYFELSKPYLTVVCALVAVVLSSFVMIRDIQKFSNK